MESYRPSGKKNPGASIILLLVTFVTGGITGGLVYLISLWYEILIIYPVAIGVFVGNVAIIIVKRYNMRTPLTAAMIALFGGVIGWSTNVFISYLSARNSVAEGLIPLLERIGHNDKSRIPDAVNFMLVKWSHGESVPKEQVLEVLANRSVLLSSKTDSNLPLKLSFLEASIGYMKLCAAAGTKIIDDDENVAWQFATAWTVNKITGRETMDYPQKEIHIGKNGTYILWLFEFLLAGCFAAWFAFDQAKEPFCEVCGKWYDSKPVLLKVGALSEKRIIKEEFEQLDVDTLCKRMANHTSEKKGVVLLCRYCHFCMAAPVSTELVTLKGDKRSTISSGLLSSKILFRLCLAGSKKLPKATVRGEESPSRPF